MKKNLKWLMGVCILAIAMTACGKEGGNTDPTPTQAVEATSTPVAEPTAEPIATPTATPTAEPTLEPTATATPTAEPTLEPTATATPTAEPTLEPTAEPTQIPAVEDTYEKGVITDTGFESKWMNLRFVTPSGAFVLSQTELDAIMKQGAEWMYGDDAQAQLDYASLTTVTEMMAQNPDGSNVIVQVEKLPVLYLLMTEEEYISAIVSNLKNSNAGVEVQTDETYYSLDIGGDTYLGITTVVDYGSGVQVYQDYIVRKKEGRMISIVFSYTQASLKNVTALAESFYGFNEEPTPAPTKEPAPEPTTPLVEVKDLLVGQYKGLNLYSVSQADVDAEIEGMLQEYIEYVAVDRAAAYGDTVNIDFVGTLDGVAFEGGTAEGYDLVLGSGSFIDGFEDGLVGATIGQTLDLNLTFPENYGSAELAGQAVVFSVTVNSILEEVVPELTDAFVADNFPEYATTAEFTEAVRDSLNQEYYYDQMTSLLMSNSVVNKYDEAWVAEEKQNLIDQYTSYAEYYGSLFGMDAESAILYILGYESVEAFEEEMGLYAYEVVKNSMIIKEIASMENLELTDDVYNARAAKYATEYGYDDVESFVTANGEDVVREAILSDVVMEYILNNAVITEAE